jgi:para-aminobenzoate synthetase / 4-amino-4-deoxychorismate lyase
MNLYFSFDHRPVCFSNPRDICVCYHPKDLAASQATVESWLNAGWYAAGYLSYEAGYAFEPRLRQEQRTAFPLLRMGAYERPLSRTLVSRRSDPYRLSHLRLNLDFPRYARNIRRIQDYIAQGDVYQITYCLKNRFRFSGNPRRLFADLFRYQPVPYAAYVEDDAHHSLCLSPERFIRKNGTRALTEPMKGTWPRGSNFLEDRRLVRQFRQDPKNLAENVMIADLLRNDLGRIGTRVRAPKLFTITKYRTLFQMTSTVTARLPPAVNFHHLLAALFPSGSVTGAPKIRAMQIIREIESEDRKIYTGAIGYITPNRDLYFNIPIRTLLLQGGEGEMGVGGGIVWDSTARGEWEEGLLKSRFLREIAGVGVFR